MENAQREPPPENRQERVKQDNGAGGECGTDGCPLCSELAHQDGRGEDRQHDPQGLHGGVVANDIRVDAALFHDEGKERKHQAEGETEYGDRADGGEEIDNALPIHRMAPV